MEKDYTSLVPKYTFGGTLEEQEAQLVTNPLMLRFTDSRKSRSRTIMLIREGYVHDKKHIGIYFSYDFFKLQE